MPVSILATAAAADGSLGFEGLNPQGAVSWYMVHRSLSDRGSAGYNALTCDGQTLDGAERAALFARMRQIRDASEDAQLRGFIDQFMGE